MRIYLKDKHALAYFQQKATPDFWDKHWKTEDLRRHIVSYTSDKLFIPLVKTFLPTGSTVLEGGCGIGHLVHALDYKGYKAIGIDFAENTVQKINQVVPELDIRLGDVRNLPIEDKSLDGYISVGVIEHFWEGYFPILSEMQRTLKPDGFLFISFPYMSPLRRLKVILGSYLISDTQSLKGYKETFYQFALNWKIVLHDMKQLGFTLKMAKSFDGVKGFKDELTWFKPWIQPIYDGKTHRTLRLRLDRLFRPFASHCMLLVMQKTIYME